MISFNKYNISLEPAKHISEKARKLLHQAVGARESNVENRIRGSKIKSIGIIVSRNYPITDYYKFLHDRNTQSDKHLQLFAWQKQPVKSQSQVFARISPVQLWINCIPRNQSSFINFVQHVINISNYMASNAITD